MNFCVSWRNWLTRGRPRWRRDEVELFLAATEWPRTMPRNFFLCRPKEDEEVLHNWGVYVPMAALAAVHTTTDTLCHHITIDRFACKTFPCFANPVKGMAHHQRHTQEISPIVTWWLVDGNGNLLDVFKRGIFAVFLLQENNFSDFLKYPNITFSRPSLLHRPNATNKSSPPTFLSRSPAQCLSCLPRVHLSLHLHHQPPLDK